MISVKKYVFPIERPHCGIPLGNGRTGVLVWGEETLNLTVNRADFWDHREGDHLPEEDTYGRLVALWNSCRDNKVFQAHFDSTNPPSNFGRSARRMPVGRFEVTFSGTRPVRAELDYASGAVTVFLKNGACVYLELPLTRQLLRLRDKGKNVSGVRCRPSREFPRSRAHQEKTGFPAPELLPDGWKMTCPDAEGSSLCCRYEQRGDDWFFLLNDTPDEALEAACAATGKYWKDFMASLPEFTLPEPEWNDFFRFCAWKTAAAAAPGGVAAGLQGPWIEEYQWAQWNGDYHFNVNVQMFYEGALRIGHPELLLPFFDMLESPAFTANLRRNARTLFGDGEAYYFFHALDDRGEQVGGLSCGSVLDPVCGLWTACLYEHYCQMTSDKVFLAERAYPFMTRIMRGVCHMLDEDFSIPLAVSAEYGGSNPDAAPGGRNPSYLLAALRHLAAILLRRAAELKRTPEPVWSEILRCLPKFTVVAGRDRYGTRGEEKHIAVWEGQDLAHCHRHHSHLATIYPFPDPEPYTEEERETVENSIDHWIETGMGQWSEWCMMWAVELDCRLGFSEAPMQRLRLWKELFVNEGDAVVYLPRSRGLVAHRRHDMVLDKRDHEIMQLEGTGGFLSAFTSLFCYEENGIVHLLRGVPRAWRGRIGFRNVPLSGNWKLSLENSSLTLTGPEGETRLLELDGVLQTCAAGSHPLPFPGVAEAQEGK